MSRAIFKPHVPTHGTLKAMKKRGVLVGLHSVYPVPVKMYY